MGPACAQLLDALGYDPDDGLPEARHVEVPVGEVVRARHAGVSVAVARLGSGRLVVVIDECPHDGGRISDGFVEGERLVCARHGWELEVDGARCKRATPACKRPEPSKLAQAAQAVQAAVLTTDLLTSRPLAR